MASSNKNLVQKSKSKITWSGIMTIFRKEIIQLMRDPYLVAFIVTLPIIQLLVTGLAVERDLKHIATVYCNYDKHNPSISLLEDFEQSSLFHMAKEVSSESEVLEGIRDGSYRIGIIIPPDYSRSLLDPTSKTNVNVIVDGTHGTIAKTIVSGVKMIVANHGKKMLAAELPTVNDDEIPTGISARTKVLYNPDMRSAYFLVPAILATIMHMLTILFTSFAIVRERETGTLELLMVTPVRSADLMIGKVLPYAAIGFLDMILTLLVMVWFFDIAISGSFLFLCLASIVFILASLGMGLIISTVSRTQVQAIQLTVGIFLPSLLLSGFVFPLEPMPWFIKIISYSLPLTYYLDIIRGVIIKGVGFSELYHQTGVLLLMAIVMVGASIMRFKKQLV